MRDQNRRALFLASRIDRAGTCVTLSGTRHSGKRIESRCGPAAVAPLRSAFLFPLPEKFPRRHEENEAVLEEFEPRATLMIRIINCFESGLNTPRTASCSSC